MSSAKKKHKRSLQSDAIIIDNGGYTIKAGSSSDEEPRCVRFERSSGGGLMRLLTMFCWFWCRVIQNCALRPKREKKVFIADQIEDIVDFTHTYFKRPFSKVLTVVCCPLSPIQVTSVQGYPVDWDLETRIWQRCLGAHVLKVVRLSSF